VQRVRIRNTPLRATLTSSAALGVAGVAETLRFTVAASTNTITSIELFSTGGSVGVVSNLPQAEFLVAGDSLGAGLHPFHALVTGADGARYRTTTLPVRLLETPFTPSFEVRAIPAPFTLCWPGVAGVAYEVLSADVVTGPFEVRAVLTPAHTGPVSWMEAETNAAWRFYRLRGVPGAESGSPSGVSPSTTSSPN
jgi:hypothetical protein